MRRDVRLAVAADVLPRGCCRPTGTAGVALPGDSDLAAMEDILCVQRSAL